MSSIDYVVIRIQVIASVWNDLFWLNLASREHLSSYFTFLSDIIHSGESLSVKKDVKMPTQSELFVLSQSDKLKYAVLCKMLYLYAFWLYANSVFRSQCPLYYIQRLIGYATPQLIS